MGNQPSLASNQVFVFAGKVYERPSPEVPLAYSLLVASILGLSTAALSYSSWQLLVASVGKSVKPESEFTKQGKSLLTIHAIEHSVDENEKLKSHLKQLTAALNTNNLLGPSPSRRGPRQEPIPEKWNDNFQAFQPYQPNKSYEVLYGLLTRLEVVLSQSHNTVLLNLHKQVDVLRTSSLELHQSLRNTIAEQSGGDSGSPMKRQPSPRRRSSLATKRTVGQSLRSFHDANVQLNQVWSQSISKGSPDSQTGLGLLQQWRNAVVHFEFHINLLKMCVDCQQAKGALGILRTQHANEVSIRTLLSDIGDVESSARALMLDLDSSAQSRESIVTRLRNFVQLVTLAAPNGLQTIHEIISAGVDQQRGDLPVLELKECLKSLQTLVQPFAVICAVRLLQESSLKLATSISHTEEAALPITDPFQNAKDIHVCGTQLVLSVLCSKPSERSSNPQTMNDSSADVQMVLVNRAMRAVLQTTHLALAQQGDTKIWQNIADDLASTVVNVVQRRQANLANQNSNSIVAESEDLPQLAVRLASLCRKWCVSTCPESEAMVAAMERVMIDPSLIRGDDRHGSTYVGDMAESVTVSSGSNQLLTTRNIGADEDMSCVNLLLESHLDHASGIVYPRSAQVIVDDPSHAVAIVRERVAALLQQAIPNASVGVSVCMGPQGEVVASSSASPNPVQNDVIVCFVMGSEDSNNKQFVFIQRGLRTETKAQVFGVLDKLDVVVGASESKGGEEKGPELQATLKELQEQGRVAILDPSDNLIQKLVQEAAMTQNNVVGFQTPGGVCRFRVIQVNHLDCPQVLGASFQKGEESAVLCIAKLPLSDKIVIFVSTALIPTVLAALQNGALRV